MHTIIAKIPAREWRGLVPDVYGGRLRVAMTCHICGATDHWTAAQMVGPQTAIPKVIHMGWSVDGKITCPACIAAKRNKTERKIPIMKVVPKDEPLVDLDQAKKHKRLVILALEDYYDEALRRYRDGKSDVSVAKELDLSDAFVVKVREEFYGMMAEPEDVASFREQLTAAKQVIVDLERQLSGLCHRNGWNI